MSTRSEPDTAAGPRGQPVVDRRLRDERDDRHAVLALICVPPAVAFAHVGGHVRAALRLDVALDPPRRILRRQDLGTFLITFMIGLGCVLAVRALRVLCRRHRGHDVAKEPRRDTNGDILAGAIGAACGGSLMLLWVHRAWTVTRRLPPEVINRLWPPGEDPTRGR